MILGFLHPLIFFISQIMSEDLNHSINRSEPPVHHIRVSSSFHYRWLFSFPQFPILFFIRFYST
ncbi:hypothetical protein Hanom_Chr02g00165081 [Helianthus anomalus]